MNWYKISQISNIQDFMQRWQNQGITIYLHENSNTILLSSLIVPKDRRNQGIGSQIMNELIDFADRNGKRLELTPGLKDKYQGTTSRGRLVNFYKRFGFLENKGRNKDYAMTNQMYRSPKNIDIN